MAFGPAQAWSLLDARDRLLPQNEQQPTAAPPAEPPRGPGLKRRILGAAGDAAWEAQKLAEQARLANVNARGAPRGKEVVDPATGRPFDAGSDGKVFKGKGAHGEDVYTSSQFDPLLHGAGNEKEVKALLAANPSLSAQYQADRAPGAAGMQRRLAGVAKDMATPKMTADDIEKLARAEKLRADAGAAQSNAGLAQGEFGIKREAALRDADRYQGETSAAAEAQYTALREKLGPEKAYAVAMQSGIFDPTQSVTASADMSRIMQGLKDKIQNPEWAIDNWLYDQGFKGNATLSEDQLAALSPGDLQIDPITGSIPFQDEYMVRVPGVDYGEDFNAPGFYTTDSKQIELLRALIAAEKRSKASQ